MPDPSGYPTNVQATVKSSSTVLVSWGPVPLHQRNGAILGYKVCMYMFFYLKERLFRFYYTREQKLFASKKKAGHPHPSFPVNLVFYLV